MEIRREFRFDDCDFLKIARLVRQQAGITLTERKRDLVYGRLSKRLRALGLNDFSAYIAHLESRRAGQKSGKW